MPSTLNPSGSNDNCFFVTAAYLLDLENVNQLPRPVVAEMMKGIGVAPPDGTNSEMEDCLKQMGPPYLLKSWVDLAGNNIDNRKGSEILGGRHGGGDGNIVWRDEQFLFGQWNVNRIGIGYTTASGRDHFIVAKDTNPPSYVCFQHNSGGTDKWKEVRGREEEINGSWHDVINKERSKVICAFAFKDTAKTRGISESRNTPGPKKAPKSRAGRVWSKFCCCC